MAGIIYSDITLDVSGVSLQHPLIRVKQNDRGTRGVRATILNDKEPFVIENGLEILINFKRTNDQRVNTYEGTLLQDGRVQFTVPSWVLEYPYAVKCDISFVERVNDDYAKLTTNDFYIQVEETTITNSDQQDDDTINYLDKLIQEVNELSDDFDAGIERVDGLEDDYEAGITRIEGLEDDYEAGITRIEAAESVINGFSQRVSDVETGKADKTITITGTGALSGGGTLAANRTITHNAGSAASKSSGFYKISTDAYSHVGSVTAVTKKDLTDLITSMAAVSGGIDLSLVTTGEKATWNAKGTYSKPQGGIPDSDLATSYLPLSAGSSKPLTGDLYFNQSGQEQIVFQKNGTTTGLIRSGNLNDTEKYIVAQTDMYYFGNVSNGNRIKIDAVSKTIFPETDKTYLLGTSSNRFDSACASGNYWIYKDTLGYNGFIIKQKGYKLGANGSGSSSTQGLGGYTVQDSGTSDGGGWTTVVESRLQDYKADAIPRVNLHLGARQATTSAGSSFKTAFLDLTATSSDAWMTASQRILPAANNSYDLGQSDLRWRNIYIGNGLYDYGAETSRGVDANSNYAGYFLVGFCQLNTYAPATARIITQDWDTGSTNCEITVDAYFGFSNNAKVYTGKIGVISSNGTNPRSAGNDFFLVMRTKDPTTSGNNNRVEIWYRGNAVYSRYKFQFVHDYANSRSDNIVKWSKVRSSSATDQSYVSAGSIAYLDTDQQFPTFIPTASWGTSAFPSTQYSGCQIFSNNATYQVNSSYTYAGTFGCMADVPNFNAFINNDVYTAAPSSTKSAQYLARDINGQYLGGMRVFHTTDNYIRAELMCRSQNTNNQGSVMLEAAKDSATTTGGAWCFRPSTNEYFDLGTNYWKWRNIYGVNVYAKEHYAKNVSYAYNEQPASNSWINRYWFTDKNNASLGAISGGILTNGNAIEIGLSNKDGAWNGIRYVNSGLAGASHAYSFRPNNNNDTDLGASGTRWRNIYGSGDLYLGETDAASKTIHFQTNGSDRGYIQAWADDSNHALVYHEYAHYFSSPSGSHRVIINPGSECIYPETTNTYSLGTSDNRFASAWAGNVSANYYSNMSTARPSSLNFTHYYDTNSVTKGKAHFRFDVAAGTQTGKPSADGYVYTYFWDNSGKYDTQVCIPNSTRNPQIRYANNAVFDSQTWYSIPLLGYSSQSGDFYATNVYASSDLRLKENIKDGELNCSDIINRLQLKEFNFKTDENKKVVFGAIAQELKAILPEKYQAELVGGSEEDYYSINEGKLLYIAIGALKDEQIKTKLLEERVEKLENTIAG